MVVLTCFVMCLLGGGVVMYGCLVICVLVLTAFCIVCTACLCCFVYVIYSYLFCLH